MSPFLSVVPLTSIVVEPSTPPAVSDNPLVVAVTTAAASSAATIFTGGSLWSQDGMYTITAAQTPSGLKSTSETFSRATDSPNAGLINYQASAEIKILDGHVVPEFGVIAVMILAVAIVSIIVVTAKTRLSLVPRY